jgi:cobalt/nickel transport system permease protein
LDTRVKLVSFVSLIIGAVVIKNVAFYGALFIVLAALVLLSKIPLKLYLVRSSFIPLFSVLLALPLPFIMPGIYLTFIHLYGFQYLTVSFEGLYTAIGFVLRVWLAAGFAVLLISTTKFSNIAIALRKMGAPEILTTLLLITYRYIFLFADEALSMVQARNMRSFNKESRIHKMKVIGQMIGSLFVRAYERGEEVYYAMISRGYIGKMKSYHSTEKLRVKDVAFLALILTFVAGLIVIDMISFPFAVLNYSNLTFLVIDLVIKKVYIFTNFTRTYWGYLIV